MDLSPFTPSSSCPYRNETSIYKYSKHTRLHMPLVLHINSYHLHFYGYPPTPTSALVAAAIKQWWMNKAKSREVSAGANVQGNLNQCSQLDIDKLKLHNVLTWNDMIADYVKNGFCGKALKMYFQMQRTGIKPDKMVFISVINACGRLSDLQAGKKIHEDVITKGFASDVFVGTALVSMYVKCQSLDNARQVFDRMPERDVVSWNAIIAGFSQNGQPHESLSYFNEMQVRGMKPNSITIISALSSCAHLLALPQGKQIHGYVIRSGIESVAVSTGFVDMYAKCGDINIATKLFERKPNRDIVSWNAIISGYAQNDHPHEALAFFSEMQVQGVKPDPITMVNVLPACAHLLALEQGKQIHGYAIRSGFDSDVFVGNTLVAMYAKCGNVNISHRLFEIMPARNVVSWNAIIAGCSQNALPHEALAFFYEMQSLGIKPNSITMVSVLPACADILALEQGKQIHGYAIRSGFESNVVVGTGLVDMYTKCGNVNIAYNLFKRMPKENVVLWNAIIAGYSGNGYPHEAITFFNEMQVLGIKPDSVTMVIVMSACAHLLAVEQGKQMHGYAIRNAFEYDVVMSNAIVDMYAKCGVVSFAHKLFARMRKRDIESWNAIIAGYSQNGYLNEALAFLNEMQIQGIKPNSMTMISILPACANFIALQQGKQIHGYAIRSGFESDVVVGNALVDMYAKCGNVNIAHKLFERMAERNVVSWNAIIAGYSQNSQPHESLAFFNKMQAQGTKPNSITIVSVLPACADLLAIDQGKQIHGFHLCSLIRDIYKGISLMTTRSLIFQVYNASRKNLLDFSTRPIFC